MAREIKFRAYDYTENNMIYFNGIFNEAPRILDDPKLIPRKLSDIMQFTSLIDRNGKEIFEDAE